MLSLPGYDKETRECLQIIYCTCKSKKRFWSIYFTACCYSYKHTFCWVDNIQSSPALLIHLSKPSLHNLSENGLRLFLSSGTECTSGRTSHESRFFSHQMNEIEEHSKLCAAKHTVLLYFQTTLTHISLTAFQKTNLLSGSHGTHLIFAWNRRF